MQTGHKSIKQNRIGCLTLALLLVVSMLLSGCAENTAVTEEPFVSEIRTLGLAPVFEYEMPDERPGVLVDRLGYLTESKKTAFFQGKEIPDSFEIIDRETGRRVYGGAVQYKEEDAVSGLLVGQGDFTDFTEEGSYYIQCDKIGCSYYFTVGGDIYFEMVKELKEGLEALKSVHAAQDEKWYLSGGWETDAEGGRDTVKACETVGYLLMAYELYPALFAELWAPETTAEEDLMAEGSRAFLQTLRYETDWFLAMQDEKTGGIYGGLRNLSEKTDEQLLLQDISEDATACFAGTMAKYSYLYQDYDIEYATTCLRAAAKAWRYLEKVPAETETGRTGRFYAAAELYRASNGAGYHNYILQNQDLILNGQDSLCLLMGETTYLSTRRRVNNDLCAEMMQALMKRVEKISAEAKAGLFLVEEEDREAIIENMTYVSVADYAVTNKEYFTLMEEHLHFLLGRNRRSELMTENPELKELAGMLMLFSAVLSEKDVAE